MFPTPRSVVCLQALGTTNGETITGNIDTLNADFLVLTVHSTTSNAATNKPTTFKLSESDDTVVSNFADVTKFVGGGSGGWTVPSWHTATSTAQGVVQMEVDCRHRKRYLKLTITPVTTQSFTAIASLHKNDTTPLAADMLALVRG